MKDWQQSAAEWAGGVAGGMLCALISGVAGLKLLSNPSDLIDIMGGFGILAGVAVGYLIGVPVGVRFVGKRLGRQGSFWLALAGAVVGLVVGYVLGAVILNSLDAPGGRVEWLWVLGFFVSVLIAAALATLGFDLGWRTRQRKVKG